MDGPTVKANAGRWYGDTHEPRRNRLHDMRSDNDKDKTSGRTFSGCDKASVLPDLPDLGNLIIWWWGPQGSLEPLLHASQLMRSSLTVKIKGPGWG